MSSVRIMTRDFANPLTLPPVELKPVRYAAHAIGGPKTAEVAVTAVDGDSRGIWELLEWLRCPIEIYDKNESCVWWGYVAGVTINVGAISVSVSLDSMSNRVAAMYSTAENQKATTDWVQDDSSVSIYGTKEILLTSSIIGVDMAQYVRDVMLGFAKKPISEVEIGDTGQVSASLDCRGWWSTLDWKYYSAIDGTAVDTVNQIANMVTACGQFLIGTEIKGGSGLYCSPFRDGTNTALFEIFELLNVGDGPGNRLLATVTKSREVVINVEPALNTNNIGIFIKEDGSVEDKWGNPAYASACPVGVWAQLKDVIPGSLDFGLLADPTVFFVEEAEYDVERERYYPIAKGQSTSIGTRINEG